MATVTLQEAQAALADLIHRLNPGEEVVITENEQPVAKLMASPVEKARPHPGRCKGMITLQIGNSTVSNTLCSFSSVPFEIKPKSAYSESIEI